MFSFTPAFKIHCCYLVPGSAVIGSHYAKQLAARQRTQTIPGEANAAARFLCRSNVPAAI